MTRRNRDKTKGREGTAAPGGVNVVSAALHRTRATFEDAMAAMREPIEKARAVAKGVDTDKFDATAGNITTAVGMGAGKIVEKARATRVALERYVKAVELLGVAVAGTTGETGPDVDGINAARDEVDAARANIATSTDQLTDGVDALVQGFGRMMVGLGRLTNEVVGSTHKIVEHGDAVIAAQNEALEAYAKGAAEVAAILAKLTAGLEQVRGKERHVAPAAPNVEVVVKGGAEPEPEAASAEPAPAPVEAKSGRVEAPAPAEPVAPVAPEAVAPAVAPVVEPTEAAASDMPEEWDPKILGVEMKPEPSMAAASSTPDLTPAPVAPGAATGLGESVDDWVESEESVLATSASGANGERAAPLPREETRVGPAPAPKSAAPKLTVEEQINAVETRLAGLLETKSGAGDVLDAYGQLDEQRRELGPEVVLTRLTSLLRDAEGLPNMVSEEAK